LRYIYDTGTMTNSNNPTRKAGSSSSGSAPTRYAGAPAPKSFDTYTDFALYVSQRKCPTCTTVFISSSSQVEALFQAWLSNKSTCIPHHVFSQYIILTTSSGHMFQSAMSQMHKLQTNLHRVSRQ
jgi:hypothetical protein